MTQTNDIGFEQTEPLTLKGYVIDWDGSGHHITLLKNKYVPYHWRDIRSFDTSQYEPKPSEDARKMNNAKGAMNRMSELSMAGGQVAIRADNHDRLFVGKVDPGCLWTGRVEFPSDKQMVMKGFRFSKMAEIDSDESELASELATSLKEARGTLGNADDDDSLLISKLIQKIDSAGRLD